MRKQNKLIPNNTTEKCWRCGEDLTLDHKCSEKSKQEYKKMLQTILKQLAKQSEVKE